MPLLAHDDPLPYQPQRLLIAGTSGAGKSTIARSVAQRVELPYFELDALFHGPHWTPRPEFAAEVEELSRGERWVMEWQYSLVRELLAERGDTLIWLDYPRALVMWRIVRRTVSRRLNRTVLWNGNTEPPLWTIFGNRDHIIRWAWDTHAKVRRRVLDLLASGTPLTVVRLTHPRQAEAWLAGPLAASSLRRDQEPRPSS